MGRKNCWNIMILSFIVCLAVFSLFSENRALAQKAGVLNFEGRYHSQYINYAREELLEVLQEMGRFDAIKSREIDRIAEDLRLRNYYRLEVDEVKKIGERAGLDFLFAGVIEKLEVYWDSGQRKYKAEAEINVRLYDAMTGRTISLFSGRGTASHSNRETSQFQALGNCFSTGFVEGIKEEFLLTSTIKEIDGEKVYFFGGRDLGIKTGSRFQILERTADEVMGEIILEQIGLLEVTSVGEEISRGRVIYSRKPVKEDHLLEETLRRSRLKLNIGYSNMPIKVDGTPGRLNLMGFRFGNEIPFSHSSSIIFGFAGGGGSFIFDTGGEHIREFSLIPGSLYLTFGGGAGFTVGMVEACGDLLVSPGFFGEILGGVKYYLRQEHGMTIALEGVGRLGTPLSRWQELDSPYYSPCGPEVRTSGFGLRFSVGLGF